MIFLKLYLESLILKFGPLLIRLLIHYIVFRSDDMPSVLEIIVEKAGNLNFLAAYFLVDIEKNNSAVKKAKWYFEGSHEELF